MTGREWPTVPLVSLSAKVAAGVRADVALYGPDVADTMVTSHVRRLAKALEHGDELGAGVSLALALATVRALDEIHSGGAR